MIWKIQLVKQFCSKLRRQKFRKHMVRYEILDGKCRIKYQHKKAEKEYWMLNATLHLIEERRSLKICAPTRENSKRIRILDHPIQAMYCNDKNLNFKNIWVEIENHHHQCQRKDLFVKIRDITRDFNFRSWAIINDQGTKLMNIDQVVGRWK